MAHAAAQGRVKLQPMNREGVSFGLLERMNWASSDLKSTPLAKPSSRYLSCLIWSSSSSRKPSCFSVSTRFSARLESLEDYDYDFEFEDDQLSSFRGLVLDVAYRPVNVVCWRRAICLEFTEKADVLEYYDQTVNSASGDRFYIPAVLRVPHLLQVVKRRRVKHSLTRKNILSRDKYLCQYCDSKEESLTIDHIIPIAQGGKWEWENLVTACARCNSKKGQKSLEETNMKLLNLPKVPKDYSIVAIPLNNAAVRMLRLNKEGTPLQWRHYLPHYYSPSTSTTK